MKRRGSTAGRWLAMAAGLLILTGAGRPRVALGEPQVARGRHGVVATVHPLATQAGLEAMRQGGNAIDAAIAAALMLGVVDGHNSGLGGGCFFLARLADGSVIALDGRETAPAAARWDMFLREGRADPRLSQHGALAVGVPGALAVYEYAATHYGRLPLREPLRRAAATAEAGFVISRSYAERLKETAAELRQFPAAAAIFLRPDGQPRRAGERLRQADLGRTCRAIADQGGSAWFYRGPFARTTADWMRAHGGLLTAEDFAAYEIKRREPLRTTYRGYEIVGFPPPSSGGVHVAQILNILEGFDLRRLGCGSPEFIHLGAEAMRLAFADRAYWLGDPEFTKVPRGLVNKDYARQLASGIHLEQITAVAEHGAPPPAKPEFFGGHTTHFSTADAAGNWVACTATINTSFGSKVVVPGAGVVLNNELDDFAAQPGATNYFGLPGAEANSVAAGKRPLSSMSPTLVLTNGVPVLALGAAGGPTIISQSVLTILYYADFGLSLGDALARPRFHHQWRPDQLRLERTVGSGVQRELARRGHALALVRALAATQAVGRDPRGRGLVSATDPRQPGAAGGW